MKGIWLKDKEVQEIRVENRRLGIWAAVEDRAPVDKRHLRDVFVIVVSAIVKPQVEVAFKYSTAA